MRKIINILLILILSIILIGCESKTLEGTSEEFSRDVYELAKIVEKDIKNYTDESSVYFKDGEGNKFIKKYKDKENLTETEKGYIELIKEAILEREENFIGVKPLGCKYNKEYDKKCLELLKFIND